MLPARSEAISRPIIFSNNMVTTILSGRKMQTRRLIKSGDARREPRDLVCPYGAAGDQLWVREMVVRGRAVIGYLHRVEYAADGTEHPSALWKWSSSSLPPIFMPRDIARIELEIVSARPEPLHEITEADARAEGVKPGLSQWSVYPGTGAAKLPETYREAFSRVWDDINGHRATWASNPWVWVITFKRIKP